MRRFGSCREQQRHLQQGALSRFSVFRQTKMSLKASIKQNRIIKTFQQTSVLQGLGFLVLWHVCMHLSVSVHTHSHVQHREVRRSLSLYTGCPGHPLHRYWFCHLSLVILDSFLRTRQTPWTSLKCVEDPWGDCHHVLALFSPLLFLGKQRAGPGSEDPVQHDNSSFCSALGQLPNIVRSPELFTKTVHEADAHCMLCRLLWCWWELLVPSLLLGAVPLACFF